MNSFLGLFNYWVFIILMVSGLYIVISRENLIKKVIGLNIFQSSVFLFFISIGKIEGGAVPIINHGSEVPIINHGSEVPIDIIYSNPLPHVLILTAIVVGVSTTALALSLIVRIYNQYKVIEDDERLEIEKLQ